jgi:hypothetical protein
MFDGRDHILDSREIPVVGGEAPSQFPHAFDRIEVRAIRRQVFEPEQGLSSLPPLLVQRRVMIARVVCDYDDPPAGTRTDLPEMPQEIETRFSIEASGLTSEDQLAVAQADGSEVSNAPPCRVVQQNRVRGLRRNPHSAPRTVLLEVNLIHGPQVNVFASCQSPEFFLPGLDPRGWRWRSQALVSAGEIQVVGIIADTVALPDSHPNASLSMLRGSCRPTGFLSARSRSASCARPRRCSGCAPRSIAAADRVAPPPSGRPARRARTGEPSRRRSEVHRRAILRLGDSSFPGRREEHRGGDDHIEIPRIGGFHPEAQVLRFPHRLSLVASCHKSITGL